MLLPYLEYFLRGVPGFTLAQPLIDALARRAWARHHLPPPPRCVKATVIRRFITPERSVFIETGTFYGDMLAMLRDDFARLYSIELHAGLAQRATRRFSRDAKITIVSGDSGAALGPLLSQVQAPAVLWLDGHYSGMLTARGARDTPIWRELEAALSLGSTRDAVLVDDARLFGHDPAYPTVAEVDEYVRTKRPGWSVHVEDDILHILDSTESPRPSLA